MSGKLTKAQRNFLAKHSGDELLDRYEGSVRRDFVGGLAERGLIAVESYEGCNPFPSNWRGTRITDLGRTALSSPNPETRGGKS